MRLAIASAFASALIGFVCAAVPLSTVEAQGQAPAAAAPAPTKIALIDALDVPSAEAFSSKYRAPSKPDPNVAQEGMAAAPAMIQAAGVECTPTEARMIGTVKDGKTTYSAVEAACKGTLGYILLQANDKVTAADCLSALFASKGKPGVLNCTLPANNNAPAAIQPFLVKAHQACVPTNASFLGEFSTALSYEVACQSGNGVIVQIQKPLKTTSTISASGSCMALFTQTSAGNPKAVWPCKLTTQESNEAMVKALATKSKPPCTATKQRFVADQGDGTEDYEFACESGGGVVVYADSKGDVTRSLPCAQAGATCTLSTVDIASAAQDLSGKVKAAGLSTCDVDKFQALKLAAGVTEAIEVTCKSGPGGVFETKNGKSVVFNCGRAMAETYTCSLNGKDAANTAMNTQLHKYGKGASCTVNGVGAAVSASSAYIEVTCADGDPGFVVKYARDANEPEDEHEIYTCADAKPMGGCHMPANNKKT